MKSALLGALRDKYGKESLTRDPGPGPGKVSLFWVRGPDGSPVEGPAVQECASFCQQGFLAGLAVVTTPIHLLVDFPP